MKQTTKTSRPKTGKKWKRLAEAAGLSTWWFESAVEEAKNLRFRATCGLKDGFSVADIIDSDILSPYHRVRELEAQLAEAQKRIVELEEHFDGMF